jgi:hypothetical protein
MIRSGVGFPALMTLLGHTSPDMTMRYVDGALTDLRREFDLARAKPRHLVPQPKISSASLPASLDGVIDACSSLTMCSKCSVVPCPTALHELPSPGSPIASPKSSLKHANSPPPETGQRLADNFRQHGSYRKRCSSTVADSW